MSKERVRERTKEQFKSASHVMNIVHLRVNNNTSGIYEERKRERQTKVSLHVVEQYHQY